uniref:Uncharacterized protein n=1 Tax=Nelumbo nucifera TaxID=4432 RepID=A0A822ZFJ5_NELNU|nr:TPA_asm: hypothetical protein HUJ06_014711 [Nelumbo nucifera]
MCHPSPEMEKEYAKKRMAVTHQMKPKLMVLKQFISLHFVDDSYIVERLYFS